MRELLEYVRSGDRDALDRFCRSARPRVADIVRRFRIDCYDLDDLLQEGFLAILQWAEAMRSGQEVLWDDPERAIIASLRRIKKSQDRHNIPAKARQPVAEWAWEGLIEQDNTRVRVEDDLDALVLLIAAQSECCSEQETEILDLLVSGSGYRTLCKEMRCNQSAARKRIQRFRTRLYPRLYEEEVACEIEGR